MGRPKGSKNRVQGVQRKVSVVKARTAGQGKRGRKPRAEMATVLYNDAKFRVEREPLNYVLTQKDPASVSYFTSLNGVFNAMLNSDACADTEGIQGILKAVESYKTYVDQITTAIDKKVIEVLG